MNIFILRVLDSTIDGVNVYHARILAGKALAESYPVEADLVVGVPDSGHGGCNGLFMNSQEFLMERHFIRTAMSEEHLLSRNRAEQRVQCKD